MATTKADKTEIKATPNDPGMELVEAFYADIPGTEYSGDITVGLNGVMYKIQRGVKVKIPVAIKEIIDNSYAMDARVATLIEEATKGLAGKPIAVM